MEGIPVPQQRPRRSGLPLDPVLQLWAGIVPPVVLYTISPTLRERIAIANPNRVALYVLPGQVLSTFSLNPVAPMLLTSVVPVIDGRPLCLHCRDYPGIVQAEWYVTGSMGDTFAVWEYDLQPWWE